jgi:hypothetical protein
MSSDTTGFVCSIGDQDSENCLASAIERFEALEMVGGPTIASAAVRNLNSAKSLRRASSI